MKRNSEMIDTVVELSDIKNLFPFKKKNPAASSLKANKNSNLPKINTKSMRSLENVASTQQFFSSRTYNQQDSAKQEEKQYECNPNDISNTIDSDMSETPSSHHRELNTEDSGIDHHRIGSFINLGNIPSNSLMTPGSAVHFSLQNSLKDSSERTLRDLNLTNSTLNTVFAPGSGPTLPSVSPTIAKWKLPNLLKTSSNPVKVDEDVIFADLKPVKFDGLFKKDFTKDELAEELKKIEAFYQERESSANKKIVGSSRNLKSGFANDNIMTDNAYPFKQETLKFSCSIL